VIEEILGVGGEGIGIEDSAAKRNRHPKLMLFVAFPAERSEAAVGGLTKLLERAGDGDQRRSLVVVAVESAEGPAEVR
jgi:hypothetical protein